MPLYRSLHRDNLLAGGEYKPVVVLTACTLGIAMAAMTLEMWIFGIAFWLIGIRLLRKMARYDPQMLRVYTNHIHEPDHYTSTPHAFRK
jgi:type IV secretion system protein VirB3